MISRKRVKASGTEVSVRDETLAVEQERSVQLAESNEERVGPEKSCQQNEHEMTDNTSRTTDININLRANVASAAPVLGPSGHAADAAEESASLVPIDPELLEDSQVRFPVNVPFYVLMMNEADADRGQTSQLTHGDYHFSW